MPFLQPGYVRWDGTKYVTDPTVEIVGPPGPPGPPGATGPAGGGGGGGVATGLAGDATGFVGSTIIQKLTGSSGVVTVDATAFNFKQSLSNPIIKQNDSAGSGNLLTIQAQNAGGSNNNGGPLLLLAGQKTGSGSNGVCVIAGGQISFYEDPSLSNFGPIQFDLDTATTRMLFASSLIDRPAVIGFDQAIGTTGKDLTIYAQQGAAGNNNGGNLLLSAGNKTGSGTTGLIALGGHDIFMYPDVGFGGLPSFGFNLTNKAAISMFYAQDATGAVSISGSTSTVGAGQDLIIHSQNALAASNTSGGSVQLVTGAKDGSGANGSIYFKFGGTSSGIVRGNIEPTHGFATFGGDTDYVTKVGPMPGFSTGNAGVWFLPSSATAGTSANVAIYGNGSQTIVNVPVAGQYIGFLDAGTSYMGQWSLSALKVFSTSLQLDSSAGSFPSSGLIKTKIYASATDLWTGINAGGDAKIISQSGASLSFGDSNNTSGWSTAINGFDVTINARNSSTWFSPSVVFADFATATTRITVTPAAASTVIFAASNTSNTIKQADLTTNSGTGATLAIQAQNETGTTSTGGALTLSSGTGTSKAGAVQLKAGTVTYAEVTEVVAGQRVVALARGADLTSTQMPSNTGDGVVYIANATVDPTANPVSGGILYSSSGAGRWRGTSGTVTTFGPAEPHCPTCGRDFAHEWQNTTSGEHLAICVPCMLLEMENTGLNTAKFAFIREGGV